MSFTAYRRMISPVLSRASGLKRRPLALHPIPGSSKKGDCTQQKNRLSVPEFQAHPALESKVVFRLIPRWNEISISGSFLDWNMLEVVSGRSRPRPRIMPSIRCESCPVLRPLVADKAQVVRNVILSLTYFHHAVRFKRNSSVGPIYLLGNSEVICFRLR
jgi:hypothetical protein